MQISTSLVTGQITDHLVREGEFTGRLHRDVEPFFIALRDAAAKAGCDLRLASGFRSFDRQLLIWNAKAAGERSVHDTHGKPLDVASLSEVELMHAILRWSALPGASRHHWGTDLDVYDARMLGEGEGPELVPEEYEAGGRFARLNQWMQENLAAQDFFRPYDQDCGGVAPEAWHISYRPLAELCASQLTPGILAAQIEGADLALKARVLEHLDEIFERYIQIP